MLDPIVRAGPLSAAGRYATLRTFMLSDSLPLLFVCALLVWVLVSFVRETWNSVPM